jgi:hypothetical protein
MAKSATSKTLGGISSQDKAKICALVADLIAVGDDPPVVPGSTMWDPRQLAKWYARCAGLSALLSAAIGDSNVWKPILTGWDPSKRDDRQFHAAMLGTLDAIQEFIGCS